MVWRSKSPRTKSVWTTKANRNGDRNHWAIRAAQSRATAGRRGPRLLVPPTSGIAGRGVDAKKKMCCPARASQEVCIDLGFAVLHEFIRPTMIGSGHNRMFPNESAICQL